MWFDREIDFLHKNHAVQGDIFQHDPSDSWNIMSYCRYPLQKIVVSDQMIGEASKVFAELAMESPERDFPSLLSPSINFSSHLPCGWSIRGQATKILVRYTVLVPIVKLQYSSGFNYVFLI